MGGHARGGNGHRFLKESGTDEQVAFLNSILESSTEYSIIVTDLAGTILAWNEGARRIYGYEAAEVVGKATLALLHHPDDVRSGQAKAVLDEALLTGTWEGKLRRVRKNGEEFTARVTKTLRRDPQGHPIGFTLISRDITEEERLAAQLAQQSRERSETAAFLNNILESSTEYSIIAMDLEGNILAWNEGARRNYGYAAEEMVGKQNVRLLHTGEDVEGGKVEAALAAARQAGSFEGEFQRVRKSGEQFTARVVITLRRGASGDPIGYLLVSKDITAEKALEEELRRKNEELAEQYRRVQEANRLKSEFVANMSHELRSPLNGIIGFAELMHGGKVGPMSDPHKEYLGDILTSSRHLLQLINDVLDLARVEAGRMEFHPEPVDLAKLVGEVRDGLRTLAAAKRIQVKTQIDPGLTGVTADPAKLKQLLYNYLSNALKFTLEGGQVTLRARPEAADTYRIEVEDTGIGIRPEDLGRLFVEFQQLDAGAAKKHKGTGLGLALTKRIVEAQGGQVGVRSAPGAGSVFFAVLPRVFWAGRESAAAAGAHPDARSETRPPAVAGVRPDRTPAGRPRAPAKLRAPAVLVVDDDPESQKLVETALMELGYRPVVMPDGESGLRAATRERPAAVVLDLRMPGMSGLEFLDRFRHTDNGSNTPVIVWTRAYLTTQDQSRLKDVAPLVVLKGRGGVEPLVKALQACLPAS
ncbi:MAG: PAS domain S-box protein [Bacillati bacterium ANGP1]|uniref:histidine kinase n=1 Tax=Candidatus Segetimicrobium genomatis TaxID=2569760 RepID=A0A537JXG2_9BACT|nr:MAG: PAS domain S-box protein [Terrabacteria group bacterium ANGP1]